MQNLQRITLEPDVEVELNFKVKAFSFFIKNIGDSDLYVSLGDHIVEDESFLIPANTYQDCFINENDLMDCATNKVYLKSSGANVVEVQATRW